LIRNYYRDLSKKFLDFNDPSNPGSFLRVPQFEALEMYIFLKEFLNNAPVYKIFEDWYHKKERFSNRADVGLEGEQLDLFGVINDKQYKAVFSRMKSNAQLYPNYIFALTMGTGKTILMATCIFYEFILTNKFPKDKRYCHNALVFAPDRTVLESLKEIYTFDKSKVVPPEYANFLDLSFLLCRMMERARLAACTGTNLFSPSPLPVTARPFGTIRASEETGAFGRPAIPAAPSRRAVPMKSASRRLPAAGLPAPSGDPGSRHRGRVTGNRNRPTAQSRAA